MLYVPVERININTHCWVLEWMHSIILLYNFITSYLDTIVLDVCHQMFLYVSHRVAWNPSIAVFHNRVIFDARYCWSDFHRIFKVAIILDLHKDIIEIWIRCVFAYTDYMQNFQWRCFRDLIVILYLLSLFPQTVYANHKNVESMIFKKIKWTSEWK